MTVNSSQEASGTKDQYSLARILGIWVLATLPMAILSWVVFPLVAPNFESDPLGSGVTRIVLLTLGLIWLFVLSMIIVRQEEGNLRWATVKKDSDLTPHGIQKLANRDAGSGCGSFRRSLGSSW